jgi:hypothetical protein
MLRFHLFTTYDGLFSYAASFATLAEALADPLAIWYGFTVFGQDETGALMQVA